jgi:nucleoside 2-deoxyribosyltransferase
MATCFVIQPFDGGTYDKRFKDVYEPAIKAAGYEPYRVDQDASVSVPIESIEDGIRSAVVCLADITLDNPNVWYELGFAFASGKPVVMICNMAERLSKKFPFDIQHKTIITYKAESSSDFDVLKASITTKIKAYVSKDAALQIMSESENVSPVAGLSQPEIMVLAILAGGFSPTSSTAIYSAKQDAERAGVTSVGFNLGMRRLLAKNFVEHVEMQEDYGSEPYPGLELTPAAWDWIEANESMFVLHRVAKEDSDIPF